MPEVLRVLLLAELKSGNEIVEVSHSHPAPPVGACFKLRRSVTTHPREDKDAIRFVERNNPIYSGDFTDAQGYFHLLEPPLPPPPPPDMDAIRAALNTPVPFDRDGHPSTREPIPERAFLSRRVLPGSTVARFQASMNLDYDRWREGDPYDSQAITEATPQERSQILHLLLAHEPKGWRDVAALSRFHEPEARRALKDIARSSNAEARIAVVRLAPELLTPGQKARVIVECLANAVLFGGLSETLDVAAEYHPPSVVEALLQATLTRSGGEAPLIAALLLHIHGKAQDRHAFADRPFWIRFNTEDPAERRAVHEELLQRIGRAPTPGGTAGKPGTRTNPPRPRRKPRAR